MCTSIVAPAGAEEGTSRRAGGGVVVGFGDGVGVNAGVLVGIGKEVLGLSSFGRTIEYPARAVVSPITAISKMTIGANPFWSFITRRLYIDDTKSQTANRDGP